MPPTKQKPTPTQEAPTQEAPTQEAPPEGQKITVVKKMLCCSNVYVANPFTGDRFYPGEEVNATIDSWLNAQISAGLIKCC